MARSRRRSIESNEGVDCCETALRAVGRELSGRAIVTGPQRYFFLQERAPAETATLGTPLVVRDVRDV
jgi:hypothetical protein